MTTKYKDRIIKYLRDAKNPKYKRSFSNILTYFNINKQPNQIDTINIYEKLISAINELIDDNIIIQYNIDKDNWVEYNPYPKKLKASD
jgi:hypothetical protein